MKNNRRDFLKLTGLAGIGLAGTDIVPGSAITKSNISKSNLDSLVWDPAGHVGIDLLLNWRLIDCLHHGLPQDMEVYDAAANSCIVPLSEWSVANRSNSIDVPDFTSGSWGNNQPVMDIELQRGGTTKVKST